MKASIRNPAILFLLVIFLPSFLAVGAAAIFLRVRIETPAFKTLAEAKVGEFLGGRVRIGHITPRFFNQVILSDLDITFENKDNRSTPVQVEQMIFRYHLLEVLTGGFQWPASVRLTDPKFVWDKADASYDFFRNLKFDSSRMGHISDLEMAGGQVRLALPAIGSAIFLTDIRGSFKPFDRSKLRLDFYARAEGLVQGKIHVLGELDYVRRTHQMKVTLDSVTFGKEISLPLEDLSGTMRWENGDLWFDQIHGRVQGWESSLTGSVLKFLTEPVADLNWEVGKKETRFRLKFGADFAAGSTGGEISVPGSRPWSFEGGIDREGREIFFEKLRLNTGYEGEGQLDVGSGNAHFTFYKERQKIAVSTNVNWLDFYLRIFLDHVKFQGLDLVTSGAVHLVPITPPGKDRVSEFQGSFKTDYFILESAPLEDFQGEFKIRPDGLRYFRTSWGQVFQMEGDIFFHNGKPDANLTLSVEGLDLGQVHDFAQRPLPENLAGWLEGKLKIKGALARPELAGNFSIKGGRIEKLEYDRAVIRFRGFPPYLPLSDSRVLKGRTTLALVGAIDLSLDNILHGIELQTADKIILWKGWSVTRTDGGSDFEINRVSSKFPALALKGGGAESVSGGTPADTVKEDRYVAVGPKVKF